MSIGKLNLVGGAKLFLEKMQHNGIELLNIKDSYVEYVENLPFFHRDPFDRMLISTAVIEDLTLITADDYIKKYAVSWIW